MPEDQETIVFSMTLPWPNSHLSPNSRARWGKINATSAARLTAIVEMRRAGVVKIEPRNYRIVYDFWPPDNRNRDLDNMAIMCKPYVDGIFQACEGNDAWIIESRAVKHESIEDGCVKISIEVIP